MRIISMAVSAALLQLLAAPALAQTPEASDTTASANTARLPELVDGKRIFPAAWFASDSPQSANDMVNRVPGFSIEDGEGVRGFGANAGNVLIDGERPTTKTQSLGDVLSQIPVSAVVRIELLEGAAASALAPGKTQVVNVVRDANAVSSGNWEAMAEYISGHIRPEFEASYATSIAGFRVSGGIELAEEDYRYLVGQEGLLTPAGVRTEWGPNTDVRMNRNGQANISLQRAFGETRFSANASYARAEGSRDWTVEATRAGETAVFRRDDGRERGEATEWEIGGDLTRTLFGWESRLALLAKGGTDQSTDIAGFNLVGAPLSYSRFSGDVTGYERIGRTTFKRAFGAHQIEFGGEYALNGQEIATAFATGNGTVFTTVTGGIGNTTVEEARWEAFIADAWTITPHLSLEGTLTSEWSTITQTGDAHQERSFNYIKPRLKLSWRPVEGLTLRAEVERGVGQLDFGAFADSAQVTDGNQNSGNPNLRPEQATTAVLGVERRWGRRGVIDFLVVFEDFTDHLTLVRLGSNIALGNTEGASRYGYNINATLPLDTLLAGLEAEVSYRWRNSEVVDPLTGQSRRFSSSNGNNFNANMRWDVPDSKLRFGGWFWRGDHNYQYRPNQVFEWTTNEAWGLFGQHRDFFGMTAEVGVETPFGNTFRRLRYDYTPDRRTGTLSRRQYRDRTRDGTFYIQLQRSF
jgi:outer membrane receptor for ferrienterochelin and colicin